jgi:hypothetical protein
MRKERVSKAPELSDSTEAGEQVAKRHGGYRLNKIF